MKASRFHFATLKETPVDAEIVSHQLMLRAGMIRRHAAGIYSWLPLGLRVLRRVEDIIREEMNRAGALELLMPSFQPAELWQESGRWNQFGPELLRLKDRHQRDACIGPTHEEIVTDIFRREVSSYRQLPINFYQIQTKFRDEIRPRFGVMRSREFIMKDAYSFDIDQEGLQKSYDRMHAAYTAIFAAAVRRNSTCWPTRARTQLRIATTMTTPQMWRPRRPRARLANVPQQHRIWRKLRLRV